MEILTELAQLIWNCGYLAGRTVARRKVRNSPDVLRKELLLTSHHLLKQATLAWQQIDRTIAPLGRAFD
jgi:hypothetical protein